VQPINEVRSEETTGTNNHIQRWGRLMVGTVSSLIFLYLSLRGVPLDQVWASLLRANLLFVLLGLIFVMGVNVAKAIRWQVILLPQAPNISLPRYFAVLMIGQAMNALAPLRVGDVARAYVLEGVGVGTTLYSILIEKAFDSLTLLALLLVVALVMPLPTWLKQSGVLLSLLLVAVLIGLILAGRGSRHIIRCAQWLEQAISPLRRLAITRRAMSAVELTRSLSQGHLLLSVTLWTIICWLPGIAGNYIIFGATALQVNNPVLAATFLIVVLYLGAIVPSSPGKVGVFHYLVVISLSLFNVEKVDALSYAVILHLVVYGPTALLGAYYIWRESQMRGQRQNL